jgi:hypothetical protein
VEADGEHVDQGIVLVQRLWVGELQIAGWGIEGVDDCREHRCSSGSRLVGVTN